MKKKIVLFRPYLCPAAKKRARETMDLRFIGQGPQVDEFEQLFEKLISHKHKAIAVNSGTSALHLAYILAGVKEGDEVIGPVFTCVATFAPCLYQRAKPIFADIQKDTLNIDPYHVEKLLEERAGKVKAIVVVDYGGNPADLNEIGILARKYNIPVIEDAAHAIGAKYKGKNIGEISTFTCFSFQAVKILTTCDGGMLTIQDPLLEEKAKRLRWFGIDRKAKFSDRWKKDIFEVGYKYQMTDVAAAMGIEGLKVLDDIIRHYKELFEVYREGLRDVPGITLIEPRGDRESSYWLATVIVEDRENLRRKLNEYGVESDPTHYRCDRYTVFGGRVYNCPNMDFLEDKYLLLPLHYQLEVEDISYIVDVIKSGW